MEEDPSRLSTFEKVALGFDVVRDWLQKSWKIGMLMAKGGYLAAERKRLFHQLGEDVYYKISKGEMRHVELENVVQQLDRLNKKSEIEEILVRNLRFGKIRRKSKKKPESTEPLENQAEATPKKDHAEKGENDV